MRAQHGGFDLGLLQRLVAGRFGCGGRRRGRLGGGQCLLGLFGGGAQRFDLLAQLLGIVLGQLLLGLLQGDLGHAGLDLQALEGFAGFHRLGRGLDGGRGLLGGLGQRGLLGARLAFGFLLFLGAAQTFLALFETLARVLGLLLLLLQLADLALGGAEILHQRNVRRAHVGAGAALDAVEQVLGAQLFVVLAQGEEMQLLRQQAGRTGLGALAATDARQRRRGRRQFLPRGGQ